MLSLFLKQKVQLACLAILDQKLETIKNEFMLYQDSAANETKSTAGDKHDTGKAMMQMEQEKLGTQLKELLNNKSILLSINSGKLNSKVNSGSLIYTNHGLFYFAIALGKIEIELQEIYIISMQSPLAKLMFNKGKNESFEFNGRIYTILEIC